jgi:nucleoside-diphosphate-sugar epimerase
MITQKQKRIILPGGAGLVGQNLVAQLKRQGYNNIVVLDKHRANLQILQKLHPDIIAEYADLAEAGAWCDTFHGADVVVMLQAQIGDLRADPFIRNNITATDHILSAIQRYNVPLTVHISSSVVKSVANDHYSNTKRVQEERVLASGVPCVVLRPTLMFGWFDRKHLGWLSRFMQKVPLFPIPGDGRYMRQPLYVGDFCKIIISCIEQPMSGHIFNITGLEKIDYIDIIRQVKQATAAKVLLVNIPYRLFYGLLTLWAVFDKNPPFTADQLQALVAHDEFEVIDWPSLFSVPATPFQQALHETFNDATYSHIILDF